MIIGCLSLVVIILGYVLVIQSMNVVVPPMFDDKPYRDSINMLKAKNLELDTKIHSLDSLNKELSHIKTEIHYETREKIKFVYTANPDTLYKYILSEIE